MKINADIRQAVKAACETQDERRHDAFIKSEEAAVEAMLAGNPALKRKLKEADKQILLLEIKRSKINDKLEQLHHIRSNAGLHKKFYGNRSRMGVWNADKFKAAGGVMPKKPDPLDLESHWRIEGVLAELAAADPSQLVPILAKYGINWK